MWVMRVATPFDNLSIRKFLTFFVAVLATVFAYILLAAPLTHAADATWNGDSIEYAQNQYIKQADAGSNDTRGFPKGTHIYTFTEPKDDLNSDKPQKIHILYFDSSADPQKAESAHYVTYDFTPPDTFKNPSDKKDVSISPHSAEDDKTTSCVVQGIGWIVCPVTKFFAGAMDWLFNVLSGFLAVRPVQTNQTNTLFRAWSYMRNFANVAFVIAFLVIIYSQVSSIGISNYGIKKILPRLIVAAVLVNISYWICAIAIDVSNILGYSIQDIFISLRNGLTGVQGNSWNVTSWESISGVILSGGTAVTAAGVGIYAALAGGGGAIYMLLPILVGVLMAVLVALLVIAARQAVITILVIISPLAFVANILPNTEKYFKKWHELGMTMLIMFPAFSVVFGGSQLAGTAIIQNADSINMIILGMAVQVAPLAITPLLLRLSGSLLNKVAGIVNNPKRGLLDQTRNFANRKKDEHKDRMLAARTDRRRDFMARATQRIDNRNRKREGWRKANQAMADARWENTHEAHRIHEASMKAGLVKSVGEAQAEAQFEALKHSDATVQGLDLQARANKLNVDLAKAKVDANWEEFRAGNARNAVAPDGLSVSALARHMDGQKDFASQLQASTMEAGMEARRKHGAEHEQQQYFAKQIQENQALQEYAGGIAEHGAESALAAAITAKRTAYAENVKESHQILKHLNLSGRQRQDLAMGKEVTIEDPNTGQIIKKFDKDSTYAREAAIEAQMRGEGNYAQIQEIIQNSGGELSYFKTTIGDEIAANRLMDKGVFLGGQTIDQVKQGTIKDEATLNMAVARTIAQGKVKPTHLATNDADAVRKIFQVAESNIQYQVVDPVTKQVSYRSMPPEKIAELSRSAQLALQNPSLMGQIADNVKVELQKYLASHPAP